MNIFDVTVGITAFNCKDTITRAVKSALENGANHVLICDDASTDGTQQIIQNIAQENNRVTFILNEVNYGVSEARNHIISACKTRYLAFLDDDDELLNGRLERQKEQFESLEKIVGTPNILCFGARKVIDDNGLISYGLGLGFDKYLKGDCLSIFALTAARRGEFKAALYGSGTLFINVESFMKLGGFDKGFRRCEDVEILVRAAKFGFYITSCRDEVILQHKTKSADKGAQIELEMRNQIIKKHLMYLIRIWVFLPIAGYFYNLSRFHCGSPQISSALRLISVLFWHPKDLFFYIRFLMNKLNHAA